MDSKELHRLKYVRVIKSEQINDKKLSKMVSVWKQLQLITWKNCIIRKRHYLLTPIELVIPIILFFVLVLIRTKLPNMKTEYVNVTDYSPIKDFHYLEQHFGHESILYYSPDDKFYENLMENVRNKMEITSDRLFGFKNEDVLMFNYTKHVMDNVHDNVIGIVFDNETKVETPTNLKYTIRIRSPSWDTENVFPTFLLPGPMNSYDVYERTGFLAMQFAIDMTYINMMANKKPNSELPYNVSIQRFPYPPYKVDPIFEMLFASILPFFTMVSFSFLCPALLKRIAEEKSTGIKELLKLMGFKSNIIWIGWLIHALMTNLVSILVIVILLMVPFSGDTQPIIILSNSVLIFIFLTLYCIASIFLCFFLSTIFTKPSITMTVGVLTWYLTYVLPNQLIDNPKLKLTYKLLLCLFPNFSMACGYKVIATMEARDVGLGWSNIFEIATGNRNDLSMAHVYLMLIVDIILYWLLTYYIECLRPGDYGLAKPWYFPFMWIKNKLNKTDKKVEDLEHDNKFETISNYEVPSSNLKTGIEIKNLKKYYGNVKAVNGLSMDIYKGEITALLGRNGAGKTTTMSILTGMFSPTSGDVKIHGHDIKTDLDDIRDIMALCPQHNLLFTDLTVYEHLLFFSKLKGATAAEARKEAEQLLTKFNIANKKDSMVAKLSGGMKRKLSLAIALVGNSKILLLDEPTSGLDPEARREVWDILTKARSPDKVIIISTHFMEEADVLGDRIAIMDHGLLQCYGTSIYLKQKYGAGYQLSLLIGDSNDETFSRDKLDKIIKELNKIILQHIPNAKFKSRNAFLVTYTLPTNDKNNFPKLFHELESSKTKLNVRSIGMSITTLEEVFLRVGDLADELLPEDQRSAPPNGDVVDSSERLVEIERDRGINLEFNRFSILFKKKWVYMIRKWKLFVVMMLLLPLAITYYTVIASRDNGDESNPPLPLHLSMYGDTEVFYTSPSSIGTSTAAGKISNTYANLVPANSRKPVDGVQEEIVQVGIDNISKYRQSLIVAGEFNNTHSTTTLNGLFSSVALHGAPISLNLITNSLIKYLMGNEYSITTINHPLKKENFGNIDFESRFKNIFIAVSWLTLLPMGLAFLVGSFLYLPLNERISNFKQIQLMTGLRAYIYWLACFLYDFAAYFIVTLLILVTICISDTTKTFTGLNELWTIMCILLMFGISGIIFCYFLSFIFKSVPSALSFLITAGTIISVVGGIITFVLETAARTDSDYEFAAKFLRNMNALIPYFSVSYALFIFAQGALNNNQCHLIPTEVLQLMCRDNSTRTLNPCCEINCINTENCKVGISYMSGEFGVSDLLLWMLIDSLIYGAIIIILIEQNIISRCWNSFLNKIYDKLYPYTVTSNSRMMASQGHINVDEDLNGKPDGNIISDQYNLIVQDFYKRYGRQHFAVNGISFNVGSGECFGLLGVNGAGKTTTFKMLTGDEIPTAGDAIANHYELSSDRKDFLAQFGYCPQFDAINEMLTGREMLKIMAMLRGVPKDKVTTEVNRWIYLLGLDKYADRLCGTYSGGNKRKLSTAMALIAEPPIILLDEPTSGVDPNSRRRLWHVLSNIKKQSVVLTSHSMEECEALCNRLGIMVNGKFECLDHVQRLKSTYGQGFTVQLKLRSIKNRENLLKLKDDFERHFSCELKDEHEGLLHYHVTDPKTTWYQLFNVMENLKQTIGGLIEDYTISETTLEQVFLSFAHRQKSGEQLTAAAAAEIPPSEPVAV